MLKASKTLLELKLIPQPFDSCGTVLCKDCLILALPHPGADAE